MNYAQIRKYDIANGPGIRTSLFVSGCRHNCPGCFNKEYQCFKYGNIWTKEIENGFINHAKDKNIYGISILGGEPLQQNPDEIYNLLKALKEEVNKSIWLWTGYVYEEIPEEYKKCLKYIDVLIDGRFVEELKDFRLKYRGSSNQRVIDVQQTLKQMKIVLYSD